MFTIDDNITTSKDIFEKESGLTFSLTALNYMYNGETFSDYKPSEFNNAKRNLIEEQISEKENKKLEIKSRIPANISLDELIQLRNAIYQQIVECHKQQDTLSDKIDDLKKVISELLMNKDKYVLLKKQYTSKMDRLNFIMDGFSNQDTNNLQYCPVCNQKGSIVLKPNMHSALYSDFINLDSRVRDIENLITNTMYEIEKKKIDYQLLQNQEITLKNDINLKRVEYQTIAQEITSYSETLLDYQRLQILNEDIETLKDNLEKVVKESQNKFNLSKIDAKLKEEVETEVIYSIKKVLDIDDVTLNKHFEPLFSGKTKGNVHGAGYVGIINSLIMLSVSRVLSRHNSFHGFLILDSPLTGYADADNNSPDKVKKFLDYVCECSSLFQIIISDNNKDILSAIQDVSGISLIQFTKSKEGRYGLLNGIF